MSAVAQPATIDTARTQIAQLSALYEMSKIFAGNGDPGTLARSGLLTPDDQAQLRWIANTPNVRDLLDDYRQQRDEAIKSQKEMLHMWGDGGQRTEEQQEAYELSLQFSEGLNIVTANIAGAIAMDLGGYLYPDDPDRQLAFAGIWKNIGEMIVSHREAVDAQHEAKGYYPGGPGLKLYAPGPREEEESPTTPFYKGVPLGGKTYNPFEREVEKPESPEGEPPDEAPSDGSEHVDGGVPAGVPSDEPNPVETPWDNSGQGQDGPNESAQDPDTRNQSLPPDRNASYPEDGADPITPASTSEEPNSSFPDDPIVNESGPAPMSMQPEPIESSPGYSAPEPIEPAPVYTPAEPIESAPLYTPPEPAYTPAEPIEFAPVYTPTEPIESAPVYTPPEPIESAPAYTPPEPIESAPVYTPPEPIASPPPMENMSPAYEPE